MQWAIADSLGLIHKDGTKTCHHHFDPPQRGWLPRFGILRGIIWMGTWKTLHPRKILHATSSISVHGSFHQASLEPGHSGLELRTWATAAPNIKFEPYIIYNNPIYPNLRRLEDKFPKRLAPFFLRRIFFTIVSIFFDIEWYFRFCR